MTSTMNYWDKISHVKAKFESADAVLVGIGAGMSTAAGLTYSGERFHKYFDDFHQKYNITDMYSGGFYPFESLEEFWAWWSRHVFYNRYDVEVGSPYKDLMELLKDRNYFVITTNVDHQMQMAGVDKSRFYYMQGDYGLFQCSKPCHDKTYDNESEIRAMIRDQKDMKIPSELIPHCPKCGEPMAMNLRIDSTFAQDTGWYAAQNQYANFVDENKDKNILLLELGVGYNTPTIIKYPFMRMTHNNSHALYVPVNMEKPPVPIEIAKQTISFADDIAKVLLDIRKS